MCPQCFACSVAASPEDEAHLKFFIELFSLNHKLLLLCHGFHKILVYGGITLLGGLCLSWADVSRLKSILHRLQSGKPS